MIKTRQILTRINDKLLKEYTAENKHFNNVISHAQSHAVFMLVDKELTFCLKTSVQKWPVKKRVGLLDA